MRIFVGLSGGVDSGVTAALLKQAGHDVTGVFIKGWYPPGMPCTWAEDRRDAMRVAAHLGLPFRTLDASAAYKRSVIEYLIREYRAGRTPNPDVMCNRDVKFGAFYEYARESGARIATGHYARTEHGRLYRGKDPGKDQSYFLWAVPKVALTHTLFPLGTFEKREVRTLAERFRLPNAKKKDSQGVCFLGNISVEDFLREELGSNEGRALLPDGSDVGTHGGAVLYTLGERVALTNAPPGPWYVVRKDLRENTVTVSRTREEAGSTRSLTLQNTNCFTEPSGKVEAQYRYHGPRIPGTYTGNVFMPDSPIPETIASGQSLALYQGEECLGGGIIT